MKWNIILTFSKGLAFLMYVGTQTYAFYTKDSAPLMVALPICGAVIIGKQYFQSKVTKDANI